MCLEVVKGSEDRYIYIGKERKSMKKKRTSFLSFFYVHIIVLGIGILSLYALKYHRYVIFYLTLLALCVT